MAVTLQFEVFGRSNTALLATVVLFGINIFTCVSTAAQLEPVRLWNLMWEKWSEFNRRQAQRAEAFENLGRKNAQKLVRFNHSVIQSC